MNITGSAARRVGGIVLFAAVMAFVAAYGVKTAGRLGSSIWAFDPPILLAAGLCVVIGYVNRFLTWLHAARRFGLKSGLSRAGHMYFGSTLGKYVPGKVGLVLARAHMAGRGSRGPAVASTAVEYGASFAAAGTLGIAGFVTYSSPGQWSVPLLALGVAGMLLLIHPVSLGFFCRLYGRIAKRDVNLRIPSYTIMLRVYLGLIITGLLNGFALYLLILSVSDSVGIANYPAIAGAYYLASMGGLLAVFAPGGLGVREGLLFLLLPAIVSKGLAVSSASVMRAMTLSAELLLAGLGWFVHWRARRARGKGVYA